MRTIDPTAAVEIVLALLAACSLMLTRWRP